MKTTIIDKIVLRFYLDFFSITGIDSAVDYFQATMKVV